MSGLFCSTYFWALGSFLNLFHYKIWDWCYVKKKFLNTLTYFCTWLYIGLEQWFSTLAVTLGSPGNFKNSCCPFCSLDQLNQNLRMGPKPPCFLNRSFYFAGKIENPSTRWFLMGRETNIYGVVCVCVCFFFHSSNAQAFKS